MAIFFLLTPLKILFPCLLAVQVNGKRMATQISVSLYVMSLFSECFQDFLTVAGFQPFDYDKPVQFSLYLCCLGFVEPLDS